jgi:hypothetical protein
MHERTWDVFIAHAGPDKAAAEHLYDLLQDSCAVFLDSRTLQLGADFDRELARAQRASLMTVVLVSPHTDRAFYQREEIARAVEMARQETQSHRVIPLYLGEMPTEVPYGLKIKNGMIVEDSGGLEIAANRILELVAELRDSRASSDNVAPEATPPSPSLDDSLEHTRRWLDEQDRARLQKSKETTARMRELLDRVRSTNAPKSDPQ